MARAHDSDGQRGGPGVAARILLLALVPVVGVALTVGSLALASRERLESSDAVSHEIDVLRDLTGLHRALTSERLLSVGLARLNLWGLDSGFVQENFGLDALDMLVESRHDVDARLVSLADDGVIDVPRIVGELGSLRIDAGRLAVDPSVVAARFELIVGDVGEAVDGQMLNGEVNNAGADRKALGASLARMHASLDANRFGALQLSSVTDVWFADDESRQGAIIGLAEHTAQFHRSIELLRAADDREVDAWATVLSSREVRAFDEGVSRILLMQGLPPNPQGVEPIIATFGGAVLRQDSLADLVDITSAQAEAEAQAARDDAAAELQRLVLIGAGVIVLTLLLTAWSARSIAMPLRRLIERTQQIRDGDLTPPDAPPTGPHDLRLAAATIEQLVENLRLLDAKSVALSRRDLDDPVLEQNLPGRLGRSLQVSTSVLRESIAAREELQQRLWHAANHDGLTGIANRSSAIERLRSILDDADGQMAILFVDLDDFKRANDAYGHAVGDEILRVIARRMADTVRPSDVVGRMGGDEFVVGLANVDDAATARALGERLVAAIRRPVDVGGVEVVVGASIGIALGQHGERPSEVMARADLAVYQAKQTRTGLHVYDDQLHHALQSRTTLERDLASALEGDDELALHYQPIVDAYTGELLRVEALLRWNRAGQGPVSPEVFIPAAEASALILEVDRWVLNRAMADAASWDGTALGNLAIAINVSGRHVLSDTFVSTVQRALAVSGLRPDRVTLELTESVLVDDLERAAENLRAVRELGVGVYVDDFGTGYTSIAHLHALPIDGIKIDRSFVSALPGARELTLVRTLVELGLQLGLTVVAEGVETEEQRAIVASLGCEFVQGFLIGRPGPASQLAALAAERS